MSPLIIDHVRRGRGGRFLITPAKVQDVRRLVDIEFRAFEKEQVNQILSYRDYKEVAHFNRSVDIYSEAISAQAPAPSFRGTLESLRLAKNSDDCNEEDGTDHRNSNNGGGSSSSGSSNNEEEDEDTIDRPLWTPGITFKKVFDTRMEETVSFAKVEMKQYSVRELQEPADIGHEGEPQMNRDWFALNEQVRRDYVGLAPHCYLGMLATEPKYQHNGAGSVLLNQILAEADDAAVEIYLEATDTARPLYERHGFLPVRELRFNPAEYGVRGIGIERQTVMVRGATNADGTRREVRMWDDAVAGTRRQVHRELQMQKRDGR